MSAVIETTLGDITVDLFINDRPRACLNFLKLCKIKYYNYNLFHTISRGFIAQTGDPSGSRSGGESIYGVLDGAEKRYFEGENEPRIKHTKMGLISFVGNEDRMVGSQFFFTLGEDLTYLDEKHCVFGEVVEGFDILEIINEVICDNDDRPYQDVRVTHTVILDDPFPDPKRLTIPSRSPSPSAERLKGGRIAPDEEIDEMEGKSQAEVTELQAEREAKARATILEMVGDLPDAEMAPPENVLFVCKLNPVTNDDDLEIIFSRFGKIKSCEVIRDKKTGDSLQYAFVEFEDKNACENAYFKMDNVLIDDRRIHVDFSQSVSKVKWSGKGRGVTHYDEKGRKSNHIDSDIGKGNYTHKTNYGSSRNEKRSSKMSDRSRSPDGNRKYKSNSNYEREYYGRSRNEASRSSNSRQNEPSSASERRNKYTRSPSPNRDKYKLSDKRKYTSKSSRDRSASPKRGRYSPPPRRIRNDAENSSSARYRKRSASPRRKRGSTPIPKRNQDYGPNRNVSVTPRKESTKKNGHHETPDRYENNASTSSHKTSAEKKSHKKRRSISSDEESDSDSDSTSEQYKKKNAKHSSKAPDKNKIKDSSERENHRSRTPEKTDKIGKIKEPTNKMKKTDTKHSSSKECDDHGKFKKRTSPDSESSGSDYNKCKSKKKKSAKKSKRDTSSESDDYKRKTKKKNKYQSDSD